MRKGKIMRLLVFMLIIMIILPAGIMAYTKLDIVNTIAQSETEQQTEPAKETTTEQSQISETIQETDSPLTNPADYEITQEVLDAIKQSDPANFDKNLNNYKAMLVKLDVHIKYKNEIERLIIEGHKLNDILTSYDFLNENYGKMEDIEIFVSGKQAGKSWAQIFKEYYQINPEFIPEAFDPDYLEELMNTPGINKDDIMIADRVSQKSTIQVNEIIGKRISGVSWMNINAELNIVNAQTKIPHVPVTTEQIKKYMQGGLTEQQVVEALVMADKMEKNPDEVISKVKLGQTKEQIYAWCYEGRYY